MPKQVYKKALLLILFSMVLMGARCNGESKVASDPPPYEVLLPIPRGEKILYAHQEVAGYEINIRSMRPDGSEKKDLLKISKTAGPFVALSPDEKRIAFDVWDPSGDVTIEYPDGQTTGFGMNWSHLFLLEEGPNQQLRGRQITGLKEKNIGDSPNVWSRDGEVLFFTHIGNLRVENVGRPDWAPYDIYEMRYDPPEIWAISKEGTNPRKITNGQIASISPDGTTLAVFRVEQGGYNYGTFLMNTDGSNERLLRKEAVACQWFPDGVRLVCLTWLGWGDMLLINTNGELIKQLTTGEKVALPLAVSPDGESIVYHQNTYNNKESLYKMRVDGSSDPVLLADEGAANRHSVWFWPPQ